MKNKYTFSQVAEKYCEEIGVDIPFMEEYLRAVFSGKPLADYDNMFKNIYSNSELFPELHKNNPQP